MFIQTETTPNPSTLKFLPGESVLEVGTADFSSEEAAQSSPLAQKIFHVNHVTGVFFGLDFVVVVPLLRQPCAKPFGPRQLLEDARDDALKDSPVHR